jgi:hypothetical protein
MRFPCAIKELPDGQWRAVSSHPAVGTVEATAPQREAVLEKLRREIRYRLELCPCSGVTEDFVELDLQAEA